LTLNKHNFKMPKEKKTTSSRLQSYVTEFGTEIFSTDNKILFCKVCNTKVSSEKRFSINQHIAAEKHPMLSANIPFNKLSNPHFKIFLEKYTSEVIPDQSTLRKSYVDNCYQETIGEIRNKVAEKKIWVSIDETTDAEGRYIASVIIGTLLTDRPGEIFLLNVEQLEKANHSTICTLFEDSLCLLWPGGIHRNDVLLFLSDAAPYMVKAGDTLKVLYTKMVHVTCTAHGLNRVAEYIRIQYPKVDKLVANVKKVFKKAPSHDALSISNAQKYFKAPQIKGNLAFIKSNFECLPTAITRLQKQGMALIEAIQIIEDVSAKFNNLKCQTGIKINEKLQTVLTKNKGFQIVCNISKILNGEEENVGCLDIPENLTSSDMGYFKYAPTTSADVERSFSVYKNLLAPNRRSFKFENIKKSLIVQCNTYFAGVEEQ
ncbi:CGG triplet repeat-binding protein 1, partial [Aphis craccivora]